MLGREADLVAGRSNIKKPSFLFFLLQWYGQLKPSVFCINHSDIFNLPFLEDDEEKVCTLLWRLSDLDIVRGGFQDDAETNH